MLDAFSNIDLFDGGDGGDDESDDDEKRTLPTELLLKAKRSLEEQAREQIEALELQCEFQARADTENACLAVIDGLKEHTNEVIASLLAPYSDPSND